MKRLIKKIAKKCIRIFVRIFKSHKKTIIKAANYMIGEAKRIGNKKPGKKKEIVRPSVEELCLELSQYDVISFDIFDTLIFRAFPDPKVIFDLWGCHYQIQYGRKMRAEAERELRLDYGTEEITLDEIYERLSIKSGIDKDDGMQTEIDLEISFCRANPFLLAVFNRLLNMGKTVIILSDMYLPKYVIKEILNRCGFVGYSDLYVSCELGKTKASGEIYGLITDLYGDTKSFVQIGDNKVSDIKNAKLHGWSAYHYKNINEVGKPFRPGEMSSLGGGLYRGIVNAFLYNGINDIDPYYKLGYVHFGLFVYGYCNWLNKLAREKSADAIWFVARDMYIVQQVYNACFGNLHNEYIPASRLALIRADFEKSSEMFFTCLRDAYSQTDELSIEEYFTSINFDFILPLLSQYNISPQDLLDDSSYQILRALILENKGYILSCLGADNAAATKFYFNLAKKDAGVRKVLFADMNGRCTSLLAIQHLLQNADVDIDLIGAQAYSISDKGFVEIMLSNNKLDTYLFSYLKNKNFYYSFKHNGIKRTRVIEAIFTESKGTLHSYVSGSDGQMLYGSKVPEKETLSKIHQGILDFAKEYHKYATKVDNDFWVSPFDAWMPVEQIIDRIPAECPELLNDMTLGN